MSRLGPTSWDHGKQRLDARAWELLLAWAEAAGATQAIEAMFAGESINRSEARPALHVALRAHEEDAGDIAPEAVVTTRIENGVVTSELAYRVTDLLVPQALVDLANIWIRVSSQHFVEY